MIPEIQKPVRPRLKVWGSTFGISVSLHHVEIMYQLKDIANARGDMLPMEHHRKIEETEANVNRPGVC